MRRSKLEILADARKKSDKAESIHLGGFDDLLKLVLGGEALPTQRRFICDSDRLRAYKGPAGCAKTSTIAAAGLLRALYQPGSKGYISRYDYNDLMTTTGERMLEMIARLPRSVLIERDKSPPMTLWLHPIPQMRKDGSVDDRPSKITFMGLKDQVVGIEASWWIVDEADEVEEARVHEIDMRMRNSGGEYMLGLAFNPPDKHHWLYTACTGRDFQDRLVGEPWLKLYEPQPDENVVNLDKGYYERLAAHLPEDQKQRFIHGEWGSTFEGQPVFREFKYNVHVKDALQFDPHAPLFRFWDFGYRRPACIWAQLDWEGRLLVFREKLGENIEARPFANVCKALTAQYFPGCTDFRDFGDPSAVQKKDTGSTLSALSAEGITLLYQTSTIEKGLRLIRDNLNQMISGEPALQFDRRGCGILIQALRGGYRLGDTPSNMNKPVKDGYYDHLADAFRYGVLNLLGGVSHVYGGARGAMDSLPTSVAYDPAFDSY